RDLRTTPDGKRLVVREGTQNDKGLDLHRLLSVDATTGKVQRVLEETNSLFFDRAMLFADQGRTLVIMGPDAKGLLAFDLETGKIEKKYPVDQLTGQIRFPDDGAKAVGITTDSKLVIWDLKAAKSAYVKLPFLPEKPRL